MKTQRRSGGDDLDIRGGSGSAQGAQRAGGASLAAGFFSNASPTDEAIKSNASGYFERCETIARAVEQLPLTTYDKGAVLWALSERQREWPRIARVAGPDCFASSAQNVTRAGLKFRAPEAPPARQSQPVTRSDMEKIILVLRGTFDARAVDDTAATIEAAFGTTGSVEFLDRNKLVFDSPVRTKLDDRSEIATLRRAGVTLRCYRPMVKTTPGLEGLTESRFESLGVTSEGKEIWVRFRFEDRPWLPSNEYAPARISGIEVFPIDVLRQPLNGVAYGYFRQTYAAEGCAPLPGASEKWKPAILTAP